MQKPKSERRPSLVEDIDGFPRLNVYDEYWVDWDDVLLGLIEAAHAGLIRGWVGVVLKCLGRLF